jgi:hemolysin activation/secretion protein
MKKTQSTLFLSLVSITTLIHPSTAQLPPRDIPRTPPPIPAPQPPLNVPFEVEPQQPLQNDQLVPIRVNKFNFLGNSVFSKKELETITNPYLGKEINQTQLDTITNSITKKYVDEGYVSSGAVYLMEDNGSEINPENAQITIHIFEGRLGSVRITGSDRLDRYVKNRISSKTPLNINNLLNELRKLNNDPLIARRSLKARLLPDNANIVNLSNLEVSLEPEKAYNLTVFLNNYRNSGVGTIERGVEFAALNPSTLGDRIGLKYANTSGSNVLFADYTIPVTPRTSLNFGYVYGSNATTEKPFDVLEIQGTSQSYTLGLRHFLLQNYSDKGSSELAIVSVYFREGEIFQEV